MSDIPIYGYVSHGPGPHFIRINEVKCTLATDDQARPLLLVQGEPIGFELVALSTAEDGTIEAYLAGNEPSEVVIVPAVALIDALQTAVKELQDWNAKLQAHRQDESDRADV